MATPASSLRPALQGPSRLPTPPALPAEAREGEAPGEAHADQDVLTQLQVGRKRRRWWPWALFGLVVAALAGVAGWRWLAPAEGPRFEMAPVEERALVVTVTATGTLQPLNQVDVGTEVSGRVAEVLVDFNDRVEAGQVLARLDTELLGLQARQAEAQVAVAEANVAQAEAGLADAERNLTRVRGLFAKSAATSSDVDTTKAAVDRAGPALLAARAQLRAARAARAISRANLERAEIKSPIAGMVISRFVEPGQVVVAALQAPVLFRLAEDLEHMELQAAVDEADIGHIRPGQKAKFTVAAWPGREFDARLTDVYNAPVTLAQVVTYQALLEVENKGDLLRPGMTVTVHVVTEQHDAARVVPNAALRFSPPREHRGPPEPPPVSITGEQVWRLDDEGKPEMVAVRTGGTDGDYTILVEGDLDVGVPLLVGRVREGQP